MNNMMFPFITALALGRNKNLTNQESMKAALTSYVGAAIPGPAGTVLSTMSAVNEESLKNKLEVAEAGLVRAENDLNVLLKKLQAAMKKGDNSITIKIDEIRDVLIRGRVIEPTAQSVSTQTEYMERFAKIVVELADKVNQIAPAGTKTSTALPKSAPKAVPAGSGTPPPTTGP